MISKEKQKELLTEAIKTAVCIDDTLVPPYVSPNKGDNIELSKRMYNSFSTNGKCCLDIYKYISIEEFNEKKDCILNNRDLVILDWELSPQKQCKYEDTLLILDELCQNSNIKFVNIYTHGEDLGTIALEVYSYYQKDKLLGKVDAIESAKQRMQELFDEHGVEYSKIEEEWSSLFIDYLINPNTRNERENVFINKIEEVCKKGDFENFRKECCLPINKILEENSIHGYKNFLLLYSLYLAKKTDKLTSTAFTSQMLTPISLKVNGTIIYITQKKPETDNDLFNELISPIVSLPNCRLIFLSLLLKNVVNSQFSLFSKDLGKLDENTLRHHCMDVSFNGANNENILSFITELVKNQVSSLLLDNVEPELFSELMRYDDGENPSIPKSDEIIRTNSFITFTPYSQIITQNHQICPGDVFVMTKPIRGYQEQNGVIKGIDYTHIMCITQSCDALRPFKVNNNIAFVLGKQADMKRALEKAEQDYFSYLPSNAEPKVIEWKKQFFTIYIPNTKLTKTEGKFTLSFVHVNEKNEAQLVGTQKEQPTLRIINNVFSNAMRIGIDLPHICDTK